MKKRLFLFVIIFILINLPAISMLIPDDYPDTIVSIEYCDKLNGQCKSLATGFLVGYKAGRKDVSGQNLYHYFLVTNRHVFEGLDKVDLKFNHHSLGTKHYPIELIQNGKPIWKTHPDKNIDAAVLYLNISYLKGDQAKYKYFLDDGRYIAYKNNFTDLGISLGDSVFILGFPLGLIGQNEKFVIVKSGIIARLHELLVKTDKGYSKGFLIDSSIFPGNSGSPVIVKPTIEALSGTKPVDSPYVIGIISAYIPYKTENSGLTLVVPMDYVRDITLEYVKELEETIKQRNMMSTKG